MERRRRRGRGGKGSKEGGRREIEGRREGNILRGREDDKKRGRKERGRRERVK